MNKVQTRGFLSLWLAGGLAAVAHADPGLELQERIRAARDRVLPALVNVQPVVRDFTSGTKEKSQVTGSGVVIRADGYVVTNYHVAGESEDVICTLWNKERVRAQLVGGDPLTDLAVLKLDFDDYKGARPPVAQFGDSDALQAGQIVMALGSPFALSRSITFGVISTTDRYLSDEFRLPTGERTGLFNTWIQTDAAINPGNSGGPLIDLGGRVVGINSRALMLANNLGFSIPSNVVREVVEALINDGRVDRSWIGVEVQPLQELEDYFAADQGGVLVSDVEADSPAADAGIRAGDLLLRIQGRPVSARFYEEIPAFYREIASYKVGTPLQVDLQRAGQPEAIQLTTAAYGRPSGDNFEAKVWGFTARSITKQMALDLRLEATAGVLVTGVKGGAASEEAGLLAGDIIHSVDDQSIADLDSFKQAYEAAAAAKHPFIMLTVQRRDSTRFVLMKLRYQSDRAEG